MTARTFRDPAGGRWVVWSVRPETADSPQWQAPSVAPLMQKGWLCFESSTDKRRLFPIPPGWYFVDDDDLWRLCERADAVDRPPMSGNADV
jgi:hypothetical protein